MVNANNNPTNTNSDSTQANQQQPPAMQSTINNPSASVPSVDSSSNLKKKKKKMFGMDPRSLATVAGLTGFFIVAMAAVVISLRTRFGAQDFSPTAPEAPSADVVQVANCSLTFNVAAETGISCEKTTYQDELSNTEGSYETLTEVSNFTIGDTIVFSVDVVNNGQTNAIITMQDDLGQLATSSATFAYTFLDSNCAGAAYDATTEILTCVSQDLAPNESESFTFRIQVDNAEDGLVLTNAVSIETTTNAGTTNEEVIDASCVAEVSIGTEPSPSPTPSPSPSVSPSPSPSPVAFCDDTCNTSAECQGDSLFCYNGRCRDTRYPEQASCTPPPTPSPSPSPSPVAYCDDTCVGNADCSNSAHICYNGRCRDSRYPESSSCTPIATPTPTPVAYCNESCIENTDCTLSNHICFSGRCRDVAYPESPNCQPPTVVQTTQPQPQPQLPTELPQSGADDFDTWIKAGLGVLGVGALLLLLL